MKKFSSIFVVFLAMSIQSFAQQFLNIYQDKVVIKQISTEEIDSMSVVEAEPRIISMWKNGEVFLTYTSAEIDSIVVTNQGGDPLSYIGIVGFNDQLYKKEIGILSKSTASEYKSFVNSLPCKDGTLLYYAVDNALDMLDNANIETPLKNVNLITFTDGLDQGSLMITDKYGSSTDYLNAMSNRIAMTKVSGHSLNAFSVGLRGRDVTNETLFKQNLQRLASSPNNAFEVSSINGLRERLREIANQIISVSNRQTMSVKIPGIDSGTRIRFVFDGKSAENSSLYIEATFNLQDRSLHDVTYHGLKATSGKTVQGTQDGIFVRYTFTGMRLESGDGLIPTSSVKHYYRLPSSSSWQLNSEFTPASDTQTSISHSGTSIFLVLDCSSSLGSDFSRMQQYANEFIDMLASNAEPFKLVAPTNVKATLDDNDLIVHISWDAVKYAQSYNVYRSNSSSYYADYELVAENVTATTWTDNNPLEGNNYYRVCAVNRNNLSSQSSSASVNVKLDTPTNVKVEMGVKNEQLVVNISWDAVKYAQSYKVYRNSDCCYGTYELVAENVTATTWTDNSPLSGSNYYKVCAVGYGLTSSQSSYANVYVTIYAPKNVTAAIDDNDLIVHISWDAVKHAQSYNVYRNGSLVAEYVTSTTWTDNNPLSGNNYYQVCAVGYGLISTHTTSSCANVNVKLDAPTNVTAALDDNDLIVHISWDAIKFAQSYQVYRSSSYYGTYELVAEDVTSTSWTDNSPLSGSNYYEICAMNRNVTSSQSSYANVNVKLDAPTNVTAAVDDNDLIVHVSWDAVKFAQSYNVYRNGSLVAEYVTSTTWTDNSPLSGSNYYKICAMNRNVTSSQSSYANVTNVKLDAPTNVKAEIDDSDLKICIFWDAVKYAQSYQVYRSSSSSGTYELVAENITETTWKDDNSFIGFNYYKVCAVNRNITSSQSDAASTYYVPEAKTAIDLGLPSGTLWASCNVGASKPEEYGGYFAWGETTPQEDYRWSTYKWCNGSSNSLTKYNTQSSYGTVDNKTELDLEDDAAHANWGGDWRMPSLDQIKELEDNCTWEWTTVNGVKGRKATSKINGNSIFLPAAGWRFGTSLYRAGSYGYYWSRSLYTSSPDYACSLHFDSDRVDWYNGDRYRGRSVRPVKN